MCVTAEPLLCSQYCFIFQTCFVVRKCNFLFDYTILCGLRFFVNIIIACEIAIQLSLFFQPILSSDGSLFCFCLWGVVVQLHVCFSCYQINSVWIMKNHMTYVCLFLMWKILLSLYHIYIFSSKDSISA